MASSLLQMAGGHSTVDYYIASVHCMSAAKSLHVLEEAGRYGTDHNPLILHVACESMHLLPHLLQPVLGCNMIVRMLKHIKSP